MQPFLHRHERKALERRRKKEPWLAMVPAYHNDILGVLAITPARVLFAHRKTLRTPVQEWPRRAFAKPLIEPRRYGVLVLRSKQATLRFELTSNDDKQELVAKVLPPKPKVDPVKELTKRPARKARAPAQDAPDPLAHRKSTEHEAKLREMVAKGVMTKQEMEWQLR